ncbi:MAG: metal transporter [Thaumarchaeota archaeon]|nr:metal transporter [Nitrososphaerota archaeon]
MKRAFFIVAALIILTPLFAYAAELVGYSEPLENIASNLGVEETPFYKGILPDYTIGGLDPYIGTLISAVIGSALVFLLVYGVSHIMRR